MQTFYTILSVTLNAALDDKASIGLLMSSEEKYFFKHSPDKLRAIKDLITVEKYDLTKDYLKTLEKSINANDENQNQTPGTELCKNDWISEKYIHYLSRYSNNLVQFSEPRSIDISFNTNDFDRVFEKYIYISETISKQEVKENILQRVKKQLYPKIKNRVNLDKTLDASHFENLFVPIEVSFIGKNGSPLAGQTVEFDKKHYNLENDIARFVSLTKAIDFGRKKGHYFVLGREPEKEEMKNHTLWEQIRDSDFLEFVDIDEVGMVEDYIRENNVKPFFLE